jgi:hypothetical protein
MLWNGFLAGAEPYLRDGKGTLRLSENVWLIDLNEGLGAFAGLVVAAREFGVGHAILPFDEEPQWLPGGSDPSTIQGRNARG